MTPHTPSPACLIEAANLEAVSLVGGFVVIVVIGLLGLVLVLLS